MRELHAGVAASFGERAEAHRVVASEGVRIAELDGFGRDAPMLGRERGHALLDRSRGDFRRHAVEVGSRRGGGRRGVGYLRGIGRGDAHEVQRHAKLFRDDLRDLGEEPLPHLTREPDARDAGVPYAYFDPSKPKRLWPPFASAGTLPSTHPPGAC